MKNISVPAKRFIKITPSELLLAINNKCQINLGYKVINAIVKTVHNRVSVLFINDKVENYANFTQVVQHLNVVYNLNLTKVEAKVSAPSNEVVEDTSKIGIAKKTLLGYMKKFQDSKENANFNKVILSDYFASNQWESYDFTKDELNTIIEYLYKTNNAMSDRYIKMVEGMIYRS